MNSQSGTSSERTQSAVMTLVTNSPLCRHANKHLYSSRARPPFACSPSIYILQIKSEECMRTRFCPDSQPLSKLLNTRHQPIAQHICQSPAMDFKALLSTNWEITQSVQFLCATARTSLICVSTCKSNQEALKIHCSTIVSFTLMIQPAIKYIGRKPTVSLHTHTHTHAH